MLRFISGLASPLLVVACVIVAGLAIAGALESEVQSSYGGVPLSVWERNITITYDDTGKEISRTVRP